MPKTRIECASDVRAAFLQAERTANAAASAALRCSDAMIEARTRGRFPVDVATQEEALLSEALSHALAARACFLKAHSGLSELATQVGLPVGFGPDDCPPDQQKVLTGRAQLAVVG